MQTPSTYIRRITEDALDEVMVEIAPDQAVNLKAAVALGLVGRVVASSLAQEAA